MRTEQEMMSLILDFAKHRSSIHAVLLNGSRADKNVPKDQFQDFDIVYITDNVDHFIDDRSWLSEFGDIMIMQTPDDFENVQRTETSSYGYLVQFADGNRIDVTFFPLSRIHEIPYDSLTVVLLDKTNSLTDIVSSDNDYHIQQPSEKLYFECCNEFWWVCPYAAKGLARNEITYAQEMMNIPIRTALFQMIRWYIGITHSFSLNPGKCGKYFQKYLERELWELLMNTYTDASIENMWNALFSMCELFRNTAIPVADHFNYEYHYTEDSHVSQYLKKLRTAEIR